MKSFFDALEKSLKSALLVLVAAIVIVIMLQIVARFILEISIPWTEELARYLLIWASYIGLGVAYRKGQLISVAIVKGKLSPALLRKAVLLSDTLCSIFAVVVVIYGVKLCLLNSDQVSPSLRFPLSIIYAAVPFGCLLFILFAFESIFSFFGGERK